MMAAASGHALKADVPVLKVLADAEASHRRDRGGERAVPSWPAGSLLPDLPAGEVVQAGVRSDFIDLRRNFLSLGSEEFTGYLRLTSEDTHAAAFLRGGSVVAAMFEWAGSMATGIQAFNSLRDTVDSGHGLVEVIGLGERVFAATQLMVAGPPVYEGLRGRFLHPAELVEHLGGTGLIGGLRVRSGSRSGVVLFHDGVLGGYTRTRPVLSTNLGPVIDLLEDPDSEASMVGAGVAPALPLVIL